MKINHTAKKVTTLTVADIPAGDSFLASGDVVCIKASPVQSLLNSRMVKEVISRGDYFVLRVWDGSLTVMKGTDRVKSLKSELNVQHTIDDFALV